VLFRSGFFTSPQGRILSDVVVLALEDRLRLRVAPRQEEAIAAHLRRFVLADRVEIRTLPELQCLTLAGPGAREALGGTVEELDRPWRHVHATVAGTEVLAERTGGLGVEAYTLWVAAAEASALAERLLEDERVRPAGFEALERVRIEAGVPRWGRDFGIESFPQETGLEEAVSYTKGCYLGQEIVARIHYRGGVQKTLRGLRFDGEIAAGTPLLAEGRPAGSATSVAFSPLLGSWVGLSILHKRAAEPGTLLEVEGGAKAEVVELPFRRG
jgi:folate-binding protein YgfZ